MCVEDQLIWWELSFVMALSTYLPVHACLRFPTNPSSPINPSIPPSLPLNCQSNTLYVCLLVCPVAVHIVVVHAKVLALLFLIHWSLLLPCWSVFVSYFVVQYTFYLFWSCSRLGGEKSVYCCALSSWCLVITSTVILPRAEVSRASDVINMVKTSLYTVKNMMRMFCLGCVGL